MPQEALARVSAQEGTVLQNLESRFGNLNDVQAGLVNQIEDKLHLILNKRIPEEKSSAKESAISDKNEELNRQCSRLEQSNENLNRILNHISEIV